ncbi:chymotrypsin-like protease CTRL-1 [Penaeus monodon]|uniref:chymotrypsin-like protease CTRL-1 n=1 Tax=Penaeus monodon TaxID=6687 RepID=UPI0018A72009|nr:chymotrypsin-like protease CTRL-1 [Penaeus monodon]
MFCAGGNMKGTCINDSGGPLVMANGTAEGPFVQIGVTSWGSKACNKPQVYTRVNKFLPWIKETCGDALICPPLRP